jgi:hypothetical protein
MGCYLALTGKQLLTFGRAALPFILKVKESKKKANN